MCERNAPSERSWKQFELKQRSPGVLVFDARGNGGGEISPTITGDHQDRITDYTAIVVEIHENLYGEPLRRLPSDGNGK